METIFWAYITTNKSTHDRREYFKQQKSLRDFFDWIGYWVKQIEEQEGTSPVVENMGVIEKKI